MGSGSGPGEPTFMETIHEFVAAAAQAMEGIKIKELTRSESAAVADRSFPVTTGYSFRFRGLPVTVQIEETELNIDGVRVGRDVDPLLFRRLKDACAERLVFQEHEVKEAYTEREKARQQAFRQKKYGPLVRKLKKVQPRRRSGSR